MKILIVYSIFIFYGSIVSAGVIESNCKLNIGGDITSLAHHTSFDEVDYHYDDFLVHDSQGERVFKVAIFNFWEAGYWGCTYLEDRLQYCGGNMVFSAYRRFQPTPDTYKKIHYNLDGTFERERTNELNSFPASVVRITPGSDIISHTLSLVYDGQMLIDRETKKVNLTCKFRLL